LTPRLTEQFCAAGSKFITPSEEIAGTSDGPYGLWLSNSVRLLQRAPHASRAIARRDLQKIRGV